VPVRSISAAFVAGLLLGGAPLPSAGAAPFTLTTLYAFNGTTQGGGPLNDGVVPVGKYLYGTTNGGGIGGNGTIYRLDTVTRVEKVLYEFTGGADGCYPNGLTLYKNVLYGTAIACGGAGYGSVFSIDPATETYHTLYSFQNGADGSYPQGNLLSLGGSLWGTADYGGATGAGTLFKIDPASLSLTPVHSFGTNVDAAYPPNSLIAFNGVLYGVTQYGGTNNTGTVYSYDPARGTEAVLYSFGVFGGVDGYRPASQLFVYQGALYGTAQAGGTHNAGVIFRVTLKTRKEDVVYNFSGGVDGATPFNGLSAVTDGSASNLVYGVASEGGTYDMGTIFAFDLATSSLTSLYSFTGGKDGYLPYSQLSYAAGLFYGNTLAGGAGGNGTIFSFRPFCSVGGLTPAGNAEQKGPMYLCNYPGL
jgi:uncharacterized repeat protein (TIGR03803 family)